MSTEQQATTNVISKNQKISNEKTSENESVVSNEENKSDKKDDQSDKKTEEPEIDATKNDRKRKKYVVDEKLITEQRINVKFLVKLKKSATDTHLLLKKAYKDQCMSRTRIFEWHKRFTEGREEVEEDVFNPEKCSKIIEQVMADKKVMIRKLAKVADVNQATVKKIVNMMKVGDRLKLEEPKKERKKRVKKKDAEDGSCPPVKQRKPRQKKSNNVPQNLEQPKGQNKAACGSLSEYLIMKQPDSQYTGHLKTNPYAGSIKDIPYIPNMTTLKDNPNIGKSNNNVYVESLTDNSNSYTGNPTNNSYTGNTTTVTNPYAGNPITNPYTRNPKDNNPYPEKTTTNPYPGYPYHGAGYTHILYPGSSFS